jgi:RHH-type proline utilization regulon transcriptional repressor/proline dehydrogenase/delta 1-pyrroline-5-carboxylate dehydrogenase
LVGALAASGVSHVARRFIVGESPQSALGPLGRLWNSGVSNSVDLLGEATVTGPEADGYAARCTDALEQLSSAAASWPPREILERDSLGPIARVNVSVKVTALTARLRAQAPNLGRADAELRLRPLLRRARDLGAHLHIDTESIDSLETTMELVFSLLAEQEFAAGPSVGLVVQAYLRESDRLLGEILDWAGTTQRQQPLVVRLVKGAYWDHEVVQARQNSWQSPVFESKSECDRNFERLTRRLLDARPLVRASIASHNLRSVAHAICYNRATGGSDTDIELQVLRGLGDDLAVALASKGLRVRTYCPIGDLVQGMAYLVRRLLENTANESFLTKQASDVPLEELLRTP